MSVQQAFPLLLSLLAIIPPACLPACLLGSLATHRPPERGKGRAERKRQRERRLGNWMSERKKLEKVPASPVAEEAHIRIDRLAAGTPRGAQRDRS